MKQDIHPTYYPEAKVTCLSCGNTWTVGATVPEIRTDVCYNCHPFFTGEQRIVDTQGQVDRFYKKLAARKEYLEQQAKEEEGLNLAEMAVSDLDLSNRVVAALKAGELNTVADVMARLEEGDDALLAIDGFGRKALVDVKKALRSREIALPGDEPGENA